MWNRLKVYGLLWLCLSLSFCCTHELNAQKSEIDPKIKQLTKEADLKFSKRNFTAGIPLFENSASLFLAQNDSLRAAVVISKIAVGQVEMGKFREALMTAQRAENLFNNTPIEDWKPHSLRLYYISIGFVWLRSFTNLEKATSYFASGLETCQSSECEDQDVIELSVNHATVLYYQRKLLLAEEAYHHANHLIDSLQPTNLNYKMAALMGLVSVENELGKFSETLMNYERLKKLLTDNNQSHRLSWLYGSMSSHFVYQGLHREALRYARQALMLEMAKPQREENSVFKYRQTMAESYRFLGQYDSAILLYKRNLRDETKLLGEQHPNLSFSLDGIASCYLKQNMDSAKVYYEKSLSLIKASKGPESHAYSSALINLSNAYEATNALDLSLEAMKEAEGIRMKLQGPSSINSLEASFSKLNCSIKPVGTQRHMRRPSK